MADATQQRVAKRAVKKAARPRAAAPAPAPTVNPWDGQMDAGDTVEFSATVEVAKDRDHRYWPRAGVAVHVRPGETPDQAWERAVGIVHAVLDDQVQKFLD